MVENPSFFVDGMCQEKWWDVHGFSMATVVTSPRAETPRLAQSTTSRPCWDMMKRRRRMTQRPQVGAVMTGFGVELTSHDPKMAGPPNWWWCFFVRKNGKSRHFFREYLGW